MKTRDILYVIVFFLIISYRVISILLDFISDGNIRFILIVILTVIGIPGWLLFIILTFYRKNKSYKILKYYIIFWMIMILFSLTEIYISIVQNTLYSINFILSFTSLGFGTGIYWTKNELNKVVNDDNIRK